MRYKKIKAFRVWVYPDNWSTEFEGWETQEPIRGLTLVLHQQKWGGIKRPTNLWQASEKRSGLRVGESIHKTRQEALDAAVKLLAKYTEESLQQMLSKKLVHQVKTQLHGE